MDNPRITKRGVEENTLAILDSSGVKVAGDILDDRLSFLDAVRTASLASDASTVPTWRMYDAVFEIFCDRGASLELVAACHRLLRELDQRYPRVFLAHGGQLVVVKEAWSPFAVGPDCRQGEGAKNAGKGRFGVGSSNFFPVVQEIAEVVNNNVGCSPNIKPVRKMVLLQYLCTVLEGDFAPRQVAYKDTMNWLLLRESLLNMILGSQRLNFKSFVRDCLAIVCKGCRTCDDNMLYAQKGLDYPDAALVFSLREIEDTTCSAVQKLLGLIMELDAMRKEADMLHLTSRADSVRSPVLELVVDELTYDKDLASPFLLAFTNSKWKLEVVLQYVRKYCSRPAVCTRKSTKSEGVATIEGLLVSLLNTTSVKNLTRKISLEVVQVLFSHALEAYLSLHCFDASGCKVGEDLASSSVVKVCNDIISLFQILRKVDKDTMLSPFVEEALFMANVIASNHS